MAVQAVDDQIDGAGWQVWEGRQGEEREMEGKMYAKLVTILFFLKMYLKTILMLLQSL